MVTVTDSLGCTASSQRIGLTQPERNVWAMDGNSATDAGTHYLGTADSSDLVLKSNGQEIVRLTGSGDMKLLGSAQAVGPVFRMEDGTLRGGGFPDFPYLEPPLCRGELAYYYPYWKTTGNAFSQLCPEITPLLGTLGNRPLIMVTDGLERMRIMNTGQVAIGTTSAPETKLHVEGDLLVRGGTFGDIITRSGEDEGVTLWARNAQAAWGLSISPDGKGHILGDWNNPVPQVTFTYDQVEIPTRLVIGDVEPRDGYRLMVQEGILTERLKVALKTSTEWSDHVFHPGYRLMPLPEVKAYIDEHGHLPGVPSADQMVEQGLDVVKTDAMLQEKIEELTLHAIALNNRLEEAERIIAALIEQLKPRIE